MRSTSLQLPLAIDVALRGTRTYIQSASLFDFLVSATGVNRNLMLSFRRKIECNIQALPAAEVDNVEKYPARFSGTGPAGEVDLVIAETLPLEAVQRRESYDEPAVIAGSRIEGRAIFSQSANGASAIDRIVALNKRLIAQTVAPQKVLVFSRINLKTLPGEDALLKIVLKSHLGVTLFRSVIVADENEVGELVFYGT